MSRDLLALDRTRHEACDARPGSGRDPAALTQARPTTVSGTADRQSIHWPALDGLRGLAVTGVVAYHLGWISGGFLGVDLFFALSGFLITTLLVRERRSTGCIDLAAFWGRRFRRLLPAVTALIAGVLVWCTVFATPAEQAGARSDARWAIPYLANWHFISSARDYWASATEASVFTHLWSLAIEEQFYLVWPVVAWCALRGRRGERRLVRVAIAGLVASILAMILFHDADAPSRVYLGTETRAAALLLGALVALQPAQRLLHSFVERHPGRAQRVITVLAALLAASWLLAGNHLDLLFRGGLLAHSVLAALLVGLLAATSGGAGRAARWLDRPWLSWLGGRSYGIYLWHWPVIVLAEPRWTSLPAPVRDLAMVTLSVVLAEISYRALEHPVRRRVGWALGSRAAWATLSMTAVATVAAVFVPSGRGHVADFELDTLGAPAVTEPAAAGAPSAAPVPRPVARPSQPSQPSPDVVLDHSNSTPAGTAEDGSDPAAGAAVGAAVAAGAGPSQVAAPAIASSLPPRHTVSRVLWIGDSVAADLAPALGAAFVAAGVTWTDGSGPGLRFTPGGGVDPVEVYGALFAANPFDTVVLQLSYWDNPADLGQLRMSLSWIRDQVRARGADLVVLTPPPVRDDLEDPGLARQLTVIGELVAAGSCAADEPSTPDCGRVHLIDAAAMWGPTMQIDIDGDGAPDRKPDGVHVCPQGAARFAAWLVDDLASRFGGISPTSPAVWVSGEWSSSTRYDTPTGACVALG